MGGCIAIFRMEAITLLTCKCKAGCCDFPTCTAFRRCGCDHDGVPVAEKRGRKPGQRGVSLGKRKKRGINLYMRGDFFESPATPKFRRSKGRESAAGGVESACSGNSFITELLSTLELLEENSYLVSRLASEVDRSDPHTWHHSQDDLVYRTAKLAGKAIMKICEIFAVGLANLQSVCGTFFEKLISAGRIWMLRRRRSFAR